GTFMMGRSDGTDIERPEHEVTVKSFSMDKTEVTNAEYSQFVQASGYKEMPAHWVNGKPIAGQESMPVRFVSAADAEAFAQWRSKRDGVQYRLPTEQEWEFAARNGSKDDLYPWGDKFEARCAMIDQANNEPAAVGTRSCPDSWGVQDLIGNVFEWTGTEASLYPGSGGSLKNITEKHLMVRGGSSFQKSTGPNAITSTFRIAVPASRRSAELGFRLVRGE
ncbi:MAG TPA: SUMF1/EgtB/PvdO family nonheme iron enzyme, partial [Pyrinomonadaceae bacterium]|nr:SUMF1/EgtB/PvdO family nonheme iron enzyme [Pyrinomonadaceae bacterium]